MQPSQARQLATDSRDIHGWFEAHGLFALIDSAQRASGVRGDLFEIGAHHGKSAVMLGNMAAETETIAVCDIFGEQDRNASGSGAGDRARRSSATWIGSRQLASYACTNASQAT